MKDQLIRWPEVYKLTRISRVTAWRKEQVGKFPKRVITGFNEVRWKKAEVMDWLKKNNLGGHQGKCTLK